MSRRCGSSKLTPTPLNAPLNVLVMKPGKTRRKSIEGDADTIVRQTTVKALTRTASVAGGRDEEMRYDKANHVKNLPRTASVAGGGETKKDELKENAGAMTRETNLKTLLQAAIVAEGETKRRKLTRNGKVAQPTVPRGGQVPS